MGASDSDFWEARGTRPRKASLLDLSLPGTHDSMTYDLSDTLAEHYAAWRNQERPSLFFVLFFFFFFQIYIYILNKYVATT